MAIHIRRREFITLLGGAAATWPLVARTQQPAADVPRIGLLWPGASAPPSPRMESFRRGLREQGYVDGRNISIELRYAQKGPQHLAELADDRVRMKVDVIVTSGDLSPKVLQQATATTPIVAMTDDMLGAGLVTNLSRPGGNITGLIDRARRAPFAASGIPGWFWSLPFCGQRTRMPSPSMR